MDGLDIKDLTEEEAMKVAIAASQVRHASQQPDEKKRHIDEIKAIKKKYSNEEVMEADGIQPAQAED